MEKNRVRIKCNLKYSGYDIDAILDRLLTAKVLNEENEVYTVSVEHLVLELICG